MITRQRIMRAAAALARRAVAPCLGIRQWPSIKLAAMRLAAHARFYEIVGALILCCFCRRDFGANVDALSGDENITRAARSMVRRLFGCWRTARAPGWLFVETWRNDLNRRR